MGSWQSLRSVWDTDSGSVPPVGAFKVRGGINLLSQLSVEECRQGVIAASTGKKMGIVCSGGNISLDHLREALRKTN